MIYSHSGSYRSSLRRLEEDVITNNEKVTPAPLYTVYVWQRFMLSEAYCDFLLLTIQPFVIKLQMYSSSLTDIFRTAESNFCFENLPLNFRLRLVLFRLRPIAIIVTIH